MQPDLFHDGRLIKYLQGLEANGLTREQIVDNYVFFTAGSCGPCRFGMYEAEYRLAVENAGFRGFRVLLFQQDDGINAASGGAGLKFASISDWAPSTRSTSATSSTMCVARSGPTK